ncbi:endonuclease VIII [Luteimonas deserti]|uniref:DNA-(apurinic or apyrimidinic site) lyase n=1 Tax=Luteimonas deserti TaxID=2752306 RepID=A0A7Z0TZK5_9GAMM|nr:endonuclease VIII [Luteimonas deserti]NYZ64085.1 endonuclease VIII [Luteimonas deserti]
MPEGPEVHDLADRLTRLLQDEMLDDVWFRDPALQRRRRLLTGQRVAGIVARGKALLIAVENGWTLYTHGHLFGFWRIVDDRDGLTSDTPPRVRLGCARGVAALYAAPSVALWRTDELDRQPYLAKLGPDVLDPAVDAAVFEAALVDPVIARRGLAVLLLEQSFAAGMGNYLRSEVLFEARLSPYRTPGDLDAPQRTRLAHALIDVPRRAYRAKQRGALPPGKEYLARIPGGFRFAVFEREGTACPRCGAVIVNVRIASRRLYWCRGCQH